MFDLEQSVSDWREEIIAIALTMGTWVGVTPQLRRLPQQLVLLPVIWLSLAGLSKASASPMEPGGGDWDTGAWLRVCLSLEPPTWPLGHSPDHLGDKRAVDVAERASRQNCRTWRVEA
jgi:hypothetical protein